MRLFSTILLLLLSIKCLSQDFISKVASMNGQEVKLHSDIAITDSIITIQTSGQTSAMKVAKLANGFYESTETKPITIKFMLNKAPEKHNKTKGFRYSHTLAMISDDKQLMPDVTYYLVLKE